MKELFYMLIQDQTQKLMIANGTKEFFFRIVKEPFIDDQRIHPKRSLIVIFNVFIVTFFLFLFIAVSLFFGFRVTFISKLPLIKFNKIYFHGILIKFWDVKLIWKSFSLVVWIENSFWKFYFFMFNICIWNF